MGEQGLNYGVVRPLTTHADVTGVDCDTKAYFYGFGMFICPSMSSRFIYTSATWIVWQMISRRRLPLA